VREYLSRLWKDPESRSVVIGLIGVIVVHLLLWLVVPHLLRSERRPSILRPHSSARQFNIEIAPDTFTRPIPKPPPPRQFVETNPDAPENTPDKTNNFAAQNQQVAQEKPDPKGDSERPAMEGRKDFQSTQIVSGTLHKQEEHLAPAPTPEATPTPPTPAVPRAEQNPLPGAEKLMGDNPTGVGTNISREVANARPIPQRIEGAKDVPLIEGATAAQPTIDPKRPRARPSLVKQQQVRPAILAESRVGTRNTGLTAINAKFNQYGLYLQRMADAVQLEFEKVVSESKTYPPVGSYVVVRFVLDSHGNIPRIIEVDNHSSDIGSRNALAGLTNRAPYGEWTEDMIATLNPDGEELMFTFYYE
jgi:hypothetical protein